jgi:hypothetical protein
MNIVTVPKEYVKKLNYDDALLYCQLLNIDGNNDWRMPTLQECKHISPLLKQHRRYDAILYWIEDYDEDGLRWVFDTISNSGLCTYSHEEYWICPIRYDTITT